MTTPEPTRGSPAPEATAPRYRSEVARRVAARAHVLQKEYQADQSHAVATLAKLRRACGRPPGADPDIWSETLAVLDDGPPHDDPSPTPEEVATHTALTLFALHQQSQRSAHMHTPGVGLGRAVARLVLARDGSEADATSPTLRRFHALGTATDFSEIAYHARGLVTLLRNEAIGLDYGLLTDDLIALQDPRRAMAVRLAWGRQYYRTDRPSPLSATDDRKKTTTEGEPV